MQPYFAAAFVREVKRSHRMCNSRGDFLIGAGRGLRLAVLGSRALRRDREAAIRPAESASVRAILFLGFSQRDNAGRDNPMMLIAVSSQA
jgi:hypothetical protein